MVVLTLDFLDAAVSIVIDRDIDRDVDRDIDRDVDRKGVKVTFAVDLTFPVEEDERRDVLLLAETTFEVGLVVVFLVDVVNLLEEIDAFLLVAAALTEN